MDFSNNDIIKGARYMTDKGYIKNCIDYVFSEEEIEKKFIICLDTFELVPFDLDSETDTNTDIAFDMCKIANVCSCYGVAAFLFKVISYIKDNNGHLSYPVDETN